MSKTDISDRSYFIKSDQSIRLSELLGKSKFSRLIFSSVLKFIFLALRKIILVNKDGNVVVIAFCRIGDTVFSIPAIKQIISRYPGYRIKILCYPESRSIYELALKNVDYTVLNKSDFFFGRRIGRSVTRRNLKSLNPFIIYDLTGSVTSASIIFNSRAGQILGYNDNVFSTIYTAFTTKSKEPLLYTHYLDAVDLGGKINRNGLYQPEYHYDPDDYILINPLAIRKAKEWNLVKYISLQKDLSKDYDVKFILPRNSLPEDVLAEMTRTGKVIITSSIDDLIAEIRKCSVYISNDTGPVYIANLLGKPSFTIYGPTNPAFIVPYGEYNRFIRNVVPCSPDNTQECYAMGGITCNHYQCMNTLSAEKVAKEVRLFLKDLGITTHHHLNVK